MQITADALQHLYSSLPNLITMTIYCIEVRLAWVCEATLVNINLFPLSTVDEGC